MEDTVTAIARGEDVQDALDNAVDQVDTAIETMMD